MVMHWVMTIVYHPYNTLVGQGTGSPQPQAVLQGRMPGGAPFCLDQSSLAGASLSVTTF